MRVFFPHLAYLLVLLLMVAMALATGSDTLMHLLIGVGAALRDLLLVSVALMLGLVTRRQHVLIPLMAVLAFAMTALFAWENAWQGAGLSPLLMASSFLAALGVAYCANACRLLVALRHHA